MMSDLGPISAQIGTRPTLLSTGAQTRSPEGVRREQDAYNRVMGRAGAVSAASTPAKRAREAAEQLVAITFVRPVLEQMRQSDNAPPPFAPSSGEKQFRSFLDAKLADEITRAAQFPLVDRIARTLLRQPPLAEPIAPVRQGETS